MDNNYQGCRFVGEKRGLKIRTMVGFRVSGMGRVGGWQAGRLLDFGR